MQAREFEELAGQQVPKLLEQYLGLTARTQANNKTTDRDLVIEAGKRRFEIELKSSGAPGPVQQAISELRKQSTGPPRKGIERVPLIAVPFMGPTGAQLCADAGISWLDLSGNASIKGRDLRIYLTGRPNEFRIRGPSAAIFSTKSSRVVRQLLMEPEATYRQKDLVKLTGLGQGNVSTIVRKLIESDYLRADGRDLKVNRPDLLLAAWREKYDFSKHRILAGHVAARSGESLLRGISKALLQEGIDHLATGLAGAWLLTHFAGFRRVTVYLRNRPDEEALGRLGIRTASSAPNLWLVLPRDDAVFVGGRARDGIPCAHPIQVYLDLKAQPERAGEAAAHLQDQFPWGENRG